MQIMKPYAYGNFSMNKQQNEFSAPTFSGRTKYSSSPSSSHSPLPAEFSYQFSPPSSFSEWKYSPPPPETNMHASDLKSEEFSFETVRTPSPNFLERKSPHPLANIDIPYSGFLSPSVGRHSSSPGLPELGVSSLPPASIFRVPSYDLAILRAPSPDGTETESIHSVEPPEPLTQHPASSVKPGTLGYFPAPQTPHEIIVPRPPKRRSSPFQQTVDPNIFRLPSYTRASSPTRTETDSIHSVALSKPLAQHPTSSALETSEYFLSPTRAIKKPSSNQISTADKERRAVALKHKKSFLIFYDETKRREKQNHHSGKVKELTILDIIKLYNKSVSPPVVFKLATVRGWIAKSKKK